MSMLLLGAGPGVDGGGADPAHTIVSITSHLTLDGFILVTTAAPHGLNNADSVTISGNSNPSYNVPIVINTVDGPTQFNTGDVAYDEDGTGGTWALT